jgi:hypothetical protein
VRERREERPERGAGDTPTESEIGISSKTSLTHLHIEEETMNQGMQIGSRRWVYNLETLRRKAAPVDTSTPRFGTLKLQN